MATLLVFLHIKELTVSHTVEITRPLFTGLGVYILLGVYCMEKAKKLYEELGAEENKPKKTDGE